MAESSAMSPPGAAVPRSVFLNFPWALYPRRIQLFLSEKGLVLETRNFQPDASKEWPPREVLDANPRGKFPVLEVEGHSPLTQSLAILHYLERVHPQPSLTGTSPFEFSKIMEIVSLADEANAVLGMWNHSASHVFAGREPQSLEAARFGARWFARKLDSLELAVEGPDFLYGGRVSMADCVAFPMLQFLDEFYGVRLPRRFERLGRWYASFRSRPSVPNHTYPAAMVSTSRRLEQQSGFSLEDICTEMDDELLHH